MLSITSAAEIKAIFRYRKFVSELEKPLVISLLMNSALLASSQADGVIQNLNF